jgi:hypothetical protein
MNRKLVPLALVFAATPLLAGCPSAGKNTVSGAVSYKGKPVTGGQMKLVYTDNKTFEMALKTDGTFLATDVPAGTAKVTVDTDRLKDMEKMPKIPFKDGKPPVPEGGPAPPVYVAIPSKYADPARTPLTLEVKAAGPTKQDFVLTD